MAQHFPIDQVGSLVRPTALLDARDDYKAGRIDREALRKVEYACILKALAMQRAVGVSIYTDGEMRRDAWQTNFSEAVEGFEDSYPIREMTRADGTRVRLQMHTKAIRGKLRQTRRLAHTDADFLKRHAPGPFKITMPSPAVIARSSYRQGVTDKAYPDVGKLRHDIAEIVQSEMKALIADGASYLQLDEGFTIYADPERMKAMVTADGDASQSAERMLEDDIALENACHDAVRGTGVTLAMHLCRGSRASFARGQGGYDWLAEHLFHRLHVDRFLLEYDSDRVGGFEPLRHVPKGKVAVLGLVSSTDPKLEKQDDLLQRIEAASKFCPIEQLAISSQCGFQGSASRDGAHMTVDQQRRKLELIADTARKVWN